MKYPIGIQTFETLIQDGYVYVDKTALVHKLVSSGRVYFLSRPRRFGKSLLLSTLKAYFEGKRELFRGLAMERLETEWAEHPVFHVDFNGENFTKDGTLEDKLEGCVGRWERIYGSDPSSRTFGERIGYVFKAAHEQTGRRVVVLIDEYDKPLLDVLDTDYTGLLDGKAVSLEEKHRNILKAFYSVFKSADPDLRFVLLTGVTKFSQVSVFSGFNQPKDISMDARYDALCGITKEELLSNFAEPIRELAVRAGVSEEDMIEQLKRQYDGYHFSEGMLDIFNPFSIINCMDSLSIKNYWFSTGSPSYLMRLLAHTDENINELVQKYYAPEEFVDYRADVERPLPMIYQSGYLTIKAYDPVFRSYLLDFPNKEVRDGFTAALASGYFKEASTSNLARNLNMALYRGDTADFMRRITSLLSGITYRFQRKDDAMECERYFQYTFYLILQMIGIYSTYVEKETSEGRIDCVIECPEHVYILEFKMDGSAESALRQINERDYAAPYLSDSRALHKLGVNFSSEKGTIDEWLEETE